MIFTGAFPGLSGDAPRAFLGRGVVIPGPPPVVQPDFTLSNDAVTTAWGVVPIGQLVPNAETPAGAYFVLVGEPAGFAVENG